MAYSPRTRDPYARETVVITPEGRRLYDAAYPDGAADGYRDTLADCTRMAILAEKYHALSVAWGNAEPPHEPTRSKSEKGLQSAIRAVAQRLPDIEAIKFGGDYRAVSCVKLIFTDGRSTAWEGDGIWVPLPESEET